VSGEELPNPSAAPVGLRTSVGEPYVPYALAVRVTRLLVRRVVVQRPAVVRDLLRPVGPGDDAEVGLVQSGRQYEVAGVEGRPELCAGPVADARPVAGRILQEPVECEPTPVHEVVTDPGLGGQVDGRGLVRSVVHRDGGLGKGLLDRTDYRVEVSGQVRVKEDYPRILADEVVMHRGYRPSRLGQDVLNWYYLRLQEGEFGDDEHPGCAEAAGRSSRGRSGGGAGGRASRIG
jgi:hypothetical protein